jgi:hypothetical protein
VSSQQTLAALRLLSERRIEYIVVGMVAGVLHGAPVTTFDLDLVHRRTAENVARLISTLNEIQARYRDDPRNLVPSGPLLMGPGHHLLTTTLGDIDLLGALAGNEAYDDLLESSEVLHLDEDLQARVVTLPALIELKRKTARPKDLAVLPVLEATLAERRRPQGG